jgi:hypothetical protein
MITNLEGWMFNDAWRQMLAMPDSVDVGDDVEQTIGALGVCYGNCGWFRGHQGTIIGITVKWLVDELRRLDDEHGGV